MMALRGPAPVTWPGWRKHLIWEWAAEAPGHERRYMSAEAERQFVDTNILVYAHNASAGRYRVRAQRLHRNGRHSG